MSRNTLLIAGLALLLAAGALILQFALPSGGGASESDLAALEEEVAALRQQGSVRIAFLNAEEAFTVFTDAVSDMRQRVADKLSEIAELQQAASGGTMSQSQYQQQLMGLKAEYLSAQFDVQVAMIDKMLAAEGFSDIRSNVRQIQERMEPVLTEMESLLSTAQMGATNAADFDSRYSQLENLYQQLDQLLVNAASVKVIAAARQVALDRGFDLVLNSKNVRVYSNPAAIVDVTDLVKAKLESYL